MKTFVKMILVVFGLCTYAVSQTYKNEVCIVYSERSGIILDNFSPQTIDNLELLCRVWGFLKYYHPAVAAGGYNWDAELFRIMPSVLEAPTSDVRNQALYAWISQLGEITEFVDYAIEVNDEVKMFPDLVWMEDTGRLEHKLVTQLSRVKNAKRTENNFYANFLNEEPFPSFIYDDAGLRLLTLFRFWNIIQYYFPYRHLTDNDWNLVLDEYIPKFIDSRTELDYKLTLLQLVAEVGNTSANLIDRLAFDGIWGNYEIPCLIKFIEGKAIIHDAGLFSTDLGDFALKKGDIITGIGGETIEEVVEKGLLYTPGSNYSAQLNELSHRLLRTNSTRVEVQLIRKGESHTVSVDTQPKRWISDKRHIFDDSNTSRLLKPEIGYLFLPTIVDSGSSLSELLEIFMRTKGIIIDLRSPHNGIAHIFHELCNYFLPEPVEVFTFSTGSSLFPGQFTFMPSIKIGNENPGYYKGIVVIIVDEKTFDASELLAMAIKKAPRTIIIGSATAASTTAVAEVVLPGSIYFRFPRLGIYCPNKQDTQRLGVPIDEVVIQSVNGIFEERDEFLERAIEIIEFYTNE